MSREVIVLGSTGSIGRQTLEVIAAHPDRMTVTALAAARSSATLIEQIGRQRGCLMAGGLVDLPRAAELLLRELRAGLIGRVSLEMPGEMLLEENSA